MIRSLISVFYIGLVIASWSVVLAFGFASGQYDIPRRNNQANMENTNFK